MPLNSKETPMRKLVLSMFVSLDGFVNGHGGEFIGPDWSPDLDRWTDGMVERFDTLVYGRRAWEEMADYWPLAGQDGALHDAGVRLARFMNDSRKLVFSREAVDVSRWSGSEKGGESLGAHLAREKAGEGKDIVVFAGANLCRSVIRSGLVDEYWILVLPRIFGGGARLFGDDGEPHGLRCLEVRPMDTGAVLLRYEAI